MRNLTNKIKLDRPSSILTKLKPAALAAIFCVTAEVNAQISAPTDPDVDCSVSPATVNSWFKTGTATLNGVVNPANSVSFPNMPNCSFYEWSYHMFLWLTSPAPAIYGGGGGRIFESSAFFDVSALDQNGQRTLTPHRAGLLTTFNVIARQVGPNHLPIVVDKQGRLFQVEPPPKQLKPPTVVAASGRRLEIAQARFENGNMILMDKKGTRIEPRPPVIPQAELKARALRPAQLPRVQRFIIDRIPVFVDLFGNLVEVEQGQADSSVLIAQNGSPIYYGIAVNEVMAYFRTMQGATVSSTLIFPTTQPELDTISAFASAHGRTFVDPEALAFEVKTSWIDTAGLANPNDYITITADIPTYDKSDPLHWVKNGNTTATLAMVGMHVVGSAAGHPEMIWATFEHISNTPDDDYSYRNSGGSVTPKAQSTGGTWLFCAANSTGPFNTQRQILSGSDIVAAAPPTPIGPDNIIRHKAWGAASDVSPNPLADTPKSNSQIISMNNAVRSVLVNGDVRRNYIMTGSTWLFAGSFPFTSFSTGQAGTSKLSNSTMETFTQGSNNRSDPGPTLNFNCFDCHPASKTTIVSHVFNDLKPLF